MNDKQLQIAQQRIAGAPELEQYRAELEHDWSGLIDTDDLTDWLSSAPSDEIIDWAEATRDM